MSTIFKRGRRVIKGQKFKPPKNYDYLQNETWKSDIPSFRCTTSSKTTDDENFMRNYYLKQEEEIQAKRRRKSRGDYDYDNLPEFEIKRRGPVERSLRSVKSVEIDLKNLDITEEIVENLEKSENFGKTLTNDPTEKSRKLSENDENPPENLHKSAKNEENMKNSSKNLTKTRKFGSKSIENVENTSKNLNKLAKNMQNNENLAQNVTKTRSKKSIDISSESIENDDDLSKISTKSSTKKSTEFGLKSMENAQNISKNLNKSAKNKENQENVTKTTRFRLKSIETEENNLGNLEKSAKNIENNTNLAENLTKTRTRKSIENDENRFENSNKSIKNKINIENLARNLTTTISKKSIDISPESFKNDDLSKISTNSRTKKSTKFGLKSMESAQNMAKNVNKSSENMENLENFTEILSKTRTKKSTENDENCSKNSNKSLKNKKNLENLAENSTKMKTKLSIERRKSIKTLDTARKSVNKSKTQILPNLVQNKKMTGKIDYSAVLARCQVPSRTGQTEDSSVFDDEDEETETEDETGAISTSVATSVISTNQNAANSDRRSKSSTRKRNLPSVAYNNESSLTFINILCSTPLQKTAKNLTTELEAVAKVPTENDHVTTPPRGHVTTPRPSHVTESQAHLTAPSGAATGDVTSSMALGQVSSTNNNTTPTADHVTPTADHVTSTADHVTSTADHVTSTADHVTSTADHVTPTSDHVTPTNNPVTSPADHVTYEGATPKSSKMKISRKNVTFQAINSPRAEKFGLKNDSLFTTDGDETSIKHFFETTRANFGSLPNDDLKSHRKRKMATFETHLPSPELIIPDPTKFTPGCRRSTRTRLKGFGKLNYETDPETKCSRVVGAKKMEVAELGAFKRYGQLLKPTKYEKSLRVLNKNDFVIEED